MAKIKVMPIINIWQRKENDFRIMSLTRSRISSLRRPKSGPVSMSDDNIFSASLSCLIIDSTLIKNHEIKYWFRTKSKTCEYVLCFSDSLNDEHEYYLTIQNILDV